MFSIYLYFCERENRITATELSEEGQLHAEIGAHIPEYPHDRFIPMQIECPECVGRAPINSHAPRVVRGILAKIYIFNSHQRKAGMGVKRVFFFSRER